MVTVPGTFSSSSTGPAGLGSSEVQVKKKFTPNSFCLLRTMLGILTSDSNFNAEGFLSNNVLYYDGVDSTICAFSRRNQKLRLSFRVADGCLFRHSSTILLPGNIRPRRSLQKECMHASDLMIKHPIQPGTAWRDDRGSPSGGLTTFRGAKGVGCSVWTSQICISW